MTSIFESEGVDISLHIGLYFVYTREKHGFAVFFSRVGGCFKTKWASRKIILQKSFTKCVSRISPFWFVYCVFFLWNAVQFSISMLRLRVPSLSIPVPRLNSDPTPEYFDFRRFCSRNFDLYPSIIFPGDLDFKKYRPFPMTSEAYCDDFEAGVAKIVRWQSELWRSYLPTIFLLIEVPVYFSKSCVDFQYPMPLSFF